VFEPKWPEEKRERLYKGWKAAVERAKGWLKEVGELPPRNAMYDI
jgi:glycerol kinase